MTLPKIIIPQDIRNKIQYIVDKVPVEVSGLGNIVFDKAENAYRVTSICLIKQEVGSAHTDLDDDAVAQALYDTRNEEGELCFWWHSHVNMDTFWSTTDHDTMDKIGANGLCIAVVFNKKQSMRGAIVMNPEGFPTIKLDNVDIITEVTYAFDSEELDKEITDKVKQRSLASTTWKGGSYWDNKEWCTKTQRYIDKVPTKETKVSEGKSLWQEEREELDRLATDPQILQYCTDTWNKMTLIEAQRYDTFEEYLEEVCMDTLLATDMATRSTIDDDDAYLGRYGGGYRL